MIVENLDSVPRKSVHDLIDESRLADPAATTKRIYREYTLGHHRAVSDATRKAMLGNLKVGNVQENMIGRAIHELNGRISFREVQVANPDVKTYLDLEFVAKNQLNRVVSSLVPRMLTDGSAAISLAWRKGGPRLHHEQWWDGETGMFVATSDTGEIFWAVSEWVDTDENRFRTVYEPHRIERFKQEGEGWKSVAWLDWTVRGKPLGVPVAHFPNGASPYGPYAESTVAKVIDVQDSLNASLFNRQVVSAFHGSPQYWASGVNEQSTLEVGAGKLWRGPKEARFGSIDPGDMEALIKDTDDLRQIVSSEFSVPTYRIGEGEWPSGVALVRADAPMIKRCDLLIDMVKPGLTYLAHKSTELANAFGGMDLDVDAIIEMVFHDADEIDPGTQVEIDQAKADLFASIMSLPRILIEKLDLFSSTELDRLMEQIDKQQDRLMVASAPLERDDTAGGF